MAEAAAEAAEAAEAAAEVEASSEAAVVRVERSALLATRGFWGRVFGSGCFYRVSIFFFCLCVYSRVGAS